MWTTRVGRGSPARSPAVGGIGARCMTPTTRRGGIWISSSTRRSCTPRCRGCAAGEHGVRLVEVARPGSGFTMLFEALVLTFAKAMPMKRVEATVREHDTRVWRIVEHHVHTARAQEDFSDVRRVGMDETSARTGQDYISLFADLDAGRVRFATEGHDADTVTKFAADLSAHGGDPKQVHTTSSDMSAAFIRGIRDSLPNAQLSVDRYHLAQKLSEAVDAVRRAEVATRPELKHTRWLWLKNWANLSTGGRSELQTAAAPLSPARHRTSAALARGLPGLLRPASKPCARVPAQLVLRRETLPPAADQGLRHAGRTPLGRRHRLARHPGLQRSAGRNQLPHPGGQGPCPRLPHQEQDDHYCVPHRWQAPHTHRHQHETCMIPTLSVTHRIWRGTDHSAGGAGRIGTR